MRVSVDSRQVFRKNRRGIGKALQLMLGHLAIARPDWEFGLLYQTDPPDDPLPSSPANLRRKRIDIPGDRFDLWERIVLPFASWRANADVVYCPANTGPAWTSCPMVLTVYDLIPLESAEPSPAAIAWGRRVRTSARVAKRVHTASDHTARQLRAILDVPSTKIDVVPIAADPRFKRVQDPRILIDVRTKYGCPRDRLMVLSFGAADPRKNTRRVLEAWAKLSSTVRSRFFLLFVGLQDAALPAFRQAAEQLLPPDSAGLHAFADEADLPALLSAAALLCYPSMAEGFGLPVLEAFGCGTPVLTSRTTSLPEVAGDAAILVDPSDSTSISNGLRDVLTDDVLRAQLAARGLERAKQFNWSSTAHAMADLFAGAVVR
jgi:glycosyltransferase involved in cell wall biosynthesis